MSTHKSASRAQSQRDSAPLPHRSGSQQLQEMFPAWSNDDLIQLLTDLNGDVSLVATRISEGSVQPWGEVSHKKDKKITPLVQPSKTSTSNRGGARGGRGGRGAPGRGGAATRGRVAHPKPSGSNGHTDSSSVTPANFNVQIESPKPTAEVTELTNGSSTAVNDSSSHADPLPATSSAWATPNKPVNDSVPAAVALTKQPAKALAGSKLSWAQIARPVEKPTPPPPVTPQPQPAQTISTAPSPPASPLQPQQNGHEEPAVVEQVTEVESTQPQAVDDWPPSTIVEPLMEPTQSEVPVASAADSRVEPAVEPVKPTTPAPEIISTPAPAPPVEPKPIPATIAVAQSTLPLQVTATPSPKPRPAGVHRSSARYKIPDQPVTLPVSFGTGIEKVGMQFGTLSLSGDSVPEPQDEPEVPAAPIAPEPAPAPVAPHTKPQVEAPAPATVPVASASLSSVFQQQTATPQQPIPTQALHSSQPPHHLPTSISQPLPTSQTTSLASVSPLQQFAQQHQSVNPQPSPLVPSSTQQNQHHHIQQQQNHTPHLPQQLQQNQGLHSYAQNSFPSQLETVQQSQTPVQPQSAQSAAHTNFFRGSEATNSSPYFQNAQTAVQSQDSYGSFGGQLGGQGQLQQGSHLAGFNNNDYGYSDNSRLYDSYSQQSFPSRNQLGHDDVKGLGGVGQQPASSLPPSSAQAPQSHSSQASNQPQPNTPQGPQQSYPPPVSYYYPHAYPQNQYYGSPYNSGYVPQPFVKYPTMFQPPGPGSAASPVSKQPANLGGGVQHQTNPYNQNVYQQGAYDDYQGHPHHTQHQHNHSLGLGQGGIGVNSGDYGKPLYGGSGQTGMQGFMGLGGQTTTGGSGPGSNSGPRPSASPETVYKPYASKDVNVASGRGGQQSQSQIQPQNQSQGPTGQTIPQGQGFYSGNRFSNNIGAGTGAGAGGTQQNGPQGHLGYPQGINDNYYGYQPRQQQPYWPQ